MKTRISVFFAATFFLLLSASAAFAQTPKAQFNPNTIGSVPIQIAISDIDSIIFKRDNIVTLITAIVKANEETTVGDFNTTGFQLKIPAGTFDSDVTMNVSGSISLASNAYNNSDAIECLGSPISIKVDGKEGTVWLKKLVNISFPLPSGFIVTPGNIYMIFGSFYNPDTKLIDYIYPDWNDLLNGIITFTTSHFTDGVPVYTKKEEEAIKKFAKDRASESLKEDEKKMSAETKSQIADLFNDIYAAMGVKEGSLREILISGALKETDLGTLAVSIREGDLGGFSSKMHELAANYFLSRMKLDPEAFADAIEIQSAVIQGVVGAINKAAEGKYKEAAAEMSSAFLEYTFPPVKYIKLGIDLINYSVASWNDYELQYALEIFERKGFTGSISNEDWNIETTTASMAAYLRSIQDKAIKAYCGINKISEDQLSDSELANIRSQAEKDLKAMMENQIEKRAEFKQKVTEYLGIIEHFKEDELLDFFDYDIPMDLRLIRLFNVRETILKIVGGPLVHPDGLRSPEECLRDATYYYVRIYVYERGGKSMRPGGQQEFIDWLIKEGYITENNTNLVGTKWRFSAPDILLPITISFNANNTCIATSSSGTVSGTWTQNGKNVTIALSYSDKEFSEKVNFSGTLTSPTTMSGSLTYIYVDFIYPEDSETVSGSFTATVI